MNQSLKGRHSAQGRTGFSLVEVMFAVLIIGILLSLLIVGVRKASSMVNETNDRQAVQNVAMGAAQFTKDFGFPPPLVRGVGTAAGPVTVLAGPPRRLSVGDQVFLQTFTLNNANPLDDTRYSHRTLPVYLAGALDVPFAADPNIPMDGVKGPGFYAPKRDGTFDVPLEVLSGANKRGTTHEPLVNLGASALKVGNDQQGGTGDPLWVALVDRYNTPIRYYRWEHVPNPNLADLNDLRVPPMVARIPAGFPMKTPSDRDLTTNVPARKARYAVVAAGRNKVFGDEPIGDLRTALSMDSGIPDIAVREAAEADNIVIVEGGQ